MADAPEKNRYAESHAAFEKARTLMPGGVNSPARSCKAVGREPVFARDAAGCIIKDIDGNAYVDYVASYGPMIVGHAHTAVVAATTRAASRGASFGMPTLAENKLAEMVIQAVPSIDVVRFVNSGTEATMSAIRLARATTGRDKIIKTIGGYHGHVDSLLVSAGSGATTLGVPSSPGVSASVAKDTLLVPYNDPAAVEQLLTHHEVAALLIEPIAGNMGCVPPAEGYLQALRDLCSKHGTLLIFDEVMTGFRVAYGGAQSLYSISPDLTCLGKIMGGGLPCAAYGGRSDLMRRMAPDGPVYQAGTLSGNPLAMAAGLATLELLQEPGTYTQLEIKSARLAEGLKTAAADANVAMTINRVGSMLTPFFTDKPVNHYDDATACDTEAFGRFFGAMLDGGVIIPPSQFEAWFVGLAHDDEAIDRSIESARAAFASLAG